MIKKRNYLKKIYKRFKIKVLLYKKIILLLMLILTTIFLINFFYNLYINNPKNIINKVYFNKKIISNPNYTQLTNYTTKIFSGLNSSKEKIFKYKSAISKIKNKFKYIKDIIIEPVSSNEIKINYIFQPPSLIFKYSGENLLVYDFYNLYIFKNLSGLNLSGANIVYLPKYINTQKNIFWKNNYKKLLFYIEKIKKIFPKSKIFYIPGGEILEIYFNNTKIWILLEKDINKQLNKFLLLKSKLDLNKIKFIDLGSLDNSIFIK